MIFHGDEADKAYHAETDDDGNAEFDTQCIHRPVKQTAGNAGHGVNFFSKDNGNVVKQYVADNAAR